MAPPKEKIELDPKTEAVFTRKGYVVTDKISEGAFGQVYKATKISDGTLAAVKVMHVEKIPKIVAEKFLPREFDTSTKIVHKNVLRVFDIFKSNNCYYIFMEFAPNGSLMSYCKKGPTPESKCKTWFKQTTEGLHCMHTEYKICHRDIKPDNILLDVDNICKLSDFGFAKVVGDEDALSATVCGTFPFYSPELVRPKGKYDPFTVDVWAMGVLLFVMLDSHYPFPKFPSSNKDKEACKSMYAMQMSKQYVYKEKISAEAKDLIAHCLDPDPKTRYTTKKILRHAWLR